MARPTGNFADGGLAEAAKQTIFISYSRADTAFADELSEGLVYDRGFDILMDRNDIHEAENWQLRLGSLIASCDAVVFVLSPNSAASQICRWEVDEAVRLSKRVVPVLAVSLNGAAAPEQLSALHYVRFDTEDDGRSRSFMKGLSSLRRALNTDIEWVREHTRLLTRAREWEAAGRAENRLLSGADIHAAKNWLDRHPREAPSPTELHRDFIQASELAENARLSVERQRSEALQQAVSQSRRAFIGASVLAASTTVLGGFAFYLKTQSDDLAKQLVQATAKRTADDSRTSGARFIGQPIFEPTKDGKGITVLAAFSFVDSKGVTWSVPAGYVSDGASLPPAVLQLVIGEPRDGIRMSAFVLHDYYSQSKERNWDETNRMLFEALIASGVGEKVATTVYMGAIFGGPRWTGAKK